MNKIETKAKHTPGPWKLLDDVIVSEQVNNYGNFIIAEILTRNEQDKANAALIAAAPELMEIARKLLDKYEGFSIVHNGDVSELRAAIAKAEGGK